MTTNATENQNIQSRTYVEPKVFLSRNGEYLTMLLPGNLVIRKHVNYFKRLLNVAYEPKTKPQTMSEVSA